MQITLRKANAIQNAIHDTIRSIDIKLNVELNEFQDAATVLADANTQLYANDARREALLLALYNIRGLVGVANSSSGIDLNLAKAAFAKDAIKQLKKQKLALTDQVLELNIKTEIPLTEDVVNTLKSEGIL
jgi:hypothetical protein